MSLDETLFAYIGCAGAGKICLLRYQSQVLELIQTVELPGLEVPGGSLPLCISPDQRFLYAAGRGEPLSLNTFAIDPDTRELTSITAFPVNESIAYLSCDADGKRLLTASYNHHVVTAWDITGGQGVQGEPSRFATAPNAHCIRLDPQGRNLLFTSLGGDRLYCAAADAQPLFSDTIEIALPEGTGPRHLVFNPEGTRLYLLGELDGSITTFDYHAEQQQLQVRQRVYLERGEADQWWTADIHMSPDGRYLLASERHSSLITSFAIAADTGELTAIEAVEVEAQPRGFAIAPHGDVLLVAGQRSSHVAAWRIDQGRLSFIDRIEVDSAPDWIEIR
ncbi:lactonase family protein [Kushneria sp. EE4]